MNTIRGVEGEVDQGTKCLNAEKPLLYTFKGALLFYFSSVAGFDLQPPLQI